MKNKSEGFSISDLVDIFLPKIWLIVIVAMLCGFAMGAYSLFVKEDTYTSEVTFDIGYEIFNLSELEYSQELVDKYKEQIKITTVVRSIYDRVLADEMYKTECEDEVTVGSISSALSFQQRGETTLFTIKVTTTDSKLSYVIAEQVKNELVEIRDDDKLMVIANPELPITPNSKNTIKNTVLGVVVGAVLSMVVIFVSNVLDITVRSRKKLEDTFDYPVLGVIPRYDVDTSAKGDKRR